jgi:hypothetical protein
MALYDSLFKIGDPVFVKIDGFCLKGNVRVILFTRSKVRYSVSVETSDGHRTTLHNIDSIWVQNRENGEYLDFEDDNYS